MLGIQWKGHRSPMYNGTTGSGKISTDDLKCAFSNISVFAAFEMHVNLHQCQDLKEKDNYSQRIDHADQSDSSQSNPESQGLSLALFYNY